MWNRIKEALSSRPASVLVMLLSITGKVGMMRFFLATNSDKLAQALMARNLMNGNGLTITTSDLADLSAVHFIKDIGWPPAYSLLLNLFPFALEDNFMLACFLVDVVSVLLFFYFCRKLLLLIGFPVWCVNFFLLFQGFFLLTGSTPTDYLSMTFLVAAIYYLVRQYQTSAFSPKAVIGCSLFLLLACFSRYQHIPVAVSLAGVMMLTGILQKKQAWWLAGSVVLVSIVVLCGAFLLYQRSQTGQAAYVVPVQHGWYPANLLDMHPFLITGLINLHFYCVQLGFHTPLGYGDCVQIAYAIGIPLLAAFTILPIIELVRKRFTVKSNWDGFLLLGFTGFASSIAVLVLLSVRLHREIGPPLFNWTYVMEKRYFMLAVFFIQVWIWRSLFVRTAVRRLALSGMLRWVFGIVVFLEVTHGMYFLAKQHWRGMSSIAGAIQLHPGQAELIRFMEDSRRRDPQRIIVATGFYKRYGFLASLYGGYGMFTPQALNTQSPASSKPAVLVVVIERNTMHLMEPFVRKPGVVLVAETIDSYIYALYVEPTSKHTNP